MLILQLNRDDLKGATEKLTKPVATSGRLMTILAARMERSVRQNFREGGRPIRWLPSKRALATGRKTLIASALLLNSISRRHRADAATVFTRDLRAPVHEFGAVIVPTRAQALTIPVSPMAVGRRATSFDRKKTFLLSRPGKHPVIMLKPDEGEPIPLFVLMKKVVIPARPFMRPPEQDLQAMLELVRDYIKSGGKIG